MPSTKETQGSQPDPDTTFVTNPNSGIGNRTNLREITSPVAVLPLTDGGDLSMVGNPDNASDLATPFLDQGLSSSPESEDERVVVVDGHVNILAAMTSGSLVEGDCALPAEAPQKLTETWAPAPGGEVESCLSSRTIRPLTSAVVEMYEAPNPLQAPSRSATFPRLARSMMDAVSIDTQEAVPRAHARGQSMYYYLVNSDDNTPNVNPECLELTSKVIEGAQDSHPATAVKDPEVANTSKTRASGNIKCKANDTPSAPKTLTSKRLPSSASQDPPRPPPVFQDKSGVYYIAEKIIDWRSNKARNGKLVVQVLVFWEGYPRQEATWEPMNTIRKDVGEKRWKELADALWLYPGDDVELNRKELLAYHRFCREQRAREDVFAEHAEDVEEITGNPFVDGDVDFF